MDDFDFFAVINLEKLADKLEDLGFVRESTSRPEHGRADRAAPNDWPEESQDDEETDPWADEPPQRSARSQARSAPRNSNPARQSSNRSRQASGGNRQNRSSRSGSDFPSDGQHYDKFDREWNFGEPDAPECEHGHTAARVLGTSQAGKAYEVWACPLGFGKNYKQKCDLWDYVR